MAATEPLHLGIDVGTSGVRGIAIDDTGAIRAQASRPMPAPASEGGGITQDPAVWWQAVAAVLDAVSAEAGRGRIRSLAVDGTSGTLLLADADGRPLAPARMYNDASAAHLAPRIEAVAPPESGAHGATSPLARLLLQQPLHPEARFALHQADWIVGRLTGRWGVSDENNALKLGYDPVARRWPDWLDALGVRRELLPEVAPPGTPLGPAAPAIAERFALAPDCLIVAGTTDGCASFLATGAGRIGDGVTALGSTLTLKLLSDNPVFSPAHGVYSHRLGDRWLVGGASNSGGNALLRFLTAERMAALTPQLAPDRPTGFHWHPLPGRGERFPVADPAMTFMPEPLPDDDLRLFQGLLEGIAEVEARAYALLRELGGPPLRSVRTVGGGAANPGWTAIRARLLGVPMPAPTSLEAAYGTALLARQGHRHG
ncbi:FGGY-family carbohydrate kinase [Benzoatithermus flavus]|uniref:FGGY-family carbohydrate kinase n=1 Tax=Benzoatithermus flavus TaxID=3108223 RepID=A0ABU8XMC2_9PROT